MRSSTARAAISTTCAKRSTAASKNRHYRIDNYSHRNGELYPTHELGPVSKVLNINRGNRYLTLTSMSTKARGLNQWALDHKGPENKWATYPFPQGDVVTTMIKCANGESYCVGS